MAEMFGCCSSYVKCSDNRACIHLGDPLYEGCYYRKNLEAGRIFYGKNQNLKNKGEKEIMEIKVIIESPELVNAINNLAAALSGGLTRLPADTTAMVKTTPAATKKGTKAAPVEAPAPEKIEDITLEAIEEVIEDVDPLAEDIKVYTLEEVRAKLTALSQAGKSAEMRQLITSFGVSKLTDIPADKYSEVMEKAGKIG